MPGHLRRWDATALRARRNRTVPTLGQQKRTSSSIFICSKGVRSDRMTWSIEAEGTARARHSLFISPRRLADATGRSVAVGAYSWDIKGESGSHTARFCRIPADPVLRRFSAVVSGSRVPGGWRTARCARAAPAPTAPGRPPFRVAGTEIWLVSLVRAGRTAAASRPGMPPGPGAADLQHAGAGVADQPGGQAQQPVAQRVRLGVFEVLAEPCTQDRRVHPRTRRRGRALGLAGAPDRGRRRPR